MLPEELWSKVGVIFNNKLCKLSSEGAIPFMFILTYAQKAIYYLINEGILSCCSHYLKSGSFGMSPDADGFYADGAVWLYLELRRKGQA